MEVDQRRLYLAEGCSSLFVWTVQALRLEAGAAYNRIEVARTARRLPAVLDAMEHGDVSLTAVRLLGPHLTQENHRDVLARARGLTKREVQLVVAELAPRPPVANSIRRLEATPPPAAAEGDAPGSRAADEGTSAVELTHAMSGTSNARRDGVDEPTLIGAAGAVPLSPELFRLHVTITPATHAKLTRARELLRHTIPTGDLGEVVDRALTLLIRHLERQRCAATPTPRVPGSPSHGSRHIPAFVRRAVWARDGGQCAFVGRRGRCRERGFLEYHHEKPYAAGGQATVDNISLRCRAHNAFEASLFFGHGSPPPARSQAP